MLETLSILGIIFALILFIIAISAIILYLAFRIKETFRDEGRKGMTVVKIAFLVGTLFLAGGSLYYFGRVLVPASTPTLTVTPSLSPTPTSLSPTPTAIVTPSPSPTPTSTQEETKKPKLILTVSYPSRVRINSKITISFTILNPTEYTAHNVNIQAGTLFEYFNLESSTHEVIGNVINVGDVPKGSVICSLELTSPRKPTEVHETVSLTYLEMEQTVDQKIDIVVTGKP